MELTEGTEFLATGPGGSQEFQISYTQIGGQNDLVLTAVAIPEPSSLLLTGLGTLLAVMMIRSRQRRQ